MFHIKHIHSFQVAQQCQKRIFSATESHNTSFTHSKFFYVIITSCSIIPYGTNVSRAFLSPSPLKIVFFKYSPVFLDYIAVY